MWGDQGKGKSRKRGIGKRSDHNNMYIVNYIHSTITGLISINTHVFMHKGNGLEFKLDMPLLPSVRPCVCIAQNIPAATSFKKNKILSM